MNGNRRFLAWMVALCAPSLALVMSMNSVASTWERVRTKPVQRSLKVTGSATKRIVSDLIEWDADIVTQNSDRTSSVQMLRTHVDQVKSFLNAHGIAESELRVSSVQSVELYENEYVTEGEQRFTRRIPKGWSTRQRISVTSKNIAIVEKASREVTDLLEKGITVSSQTPLYHYTKLDELKIDMLAKAAENARARAEKIVFEGGGGKLGRLSNADMGVININPANSVAASWDGNNDKSAYEKDIITIVHLSFEL